MELKLVTSKKSALYLLADKSSLACQTNILSPCSLKEQMEEAALAYSDLLEGKDKPVVGSTCKYDAGTFRMTVPTVPG